VKTYRSWYHALLARDGQPFWPDAAWRDVVFGFLVIATVVGLAIVVGPPEIGKPPDQTIIQASPRPSNTSATLHRNTPRMKKTISSRRFGKWRGRG
jgi:hypothetical protein